MPALTEAVFLLDHFLDHFPSSSFLLLLTPILPFFHSFSFARQFQSTAHKTEFFIFKVLLRSTGECSHAVDDAADDGPDENDGEVGGAKNIRLRCKNVDYLIGWLNVLAETAKLAYEVRWKCLILLVSCGFFWFSPLFSCLPTMIADF
jgi:hypothetical protein